MNGKLILLFGNKASAGYDWLLDTLFPRCCLVCDRPGEWLCPACRNNLNINKISRCPVCRRTALNNSVCPDCSTKKGELGSFYLDGLEVVGHYDELEKIIKAVKFKFIIEAIDCLNPLIADYLSYRQPNFAHWTIIAVPLHPRRKRWRGFNQAELLAGSIGRILDLEVQNDWLKRKKYTAQQSQLPVRKRTKNLLNAFEATGNVVGKKILLIDDVATTGATLSEATKALKQAGAERVWGFVLARD